MQVNSVGKLTQYTQTFMRVLSAVTLPFQRCYQCYHSVMQSSAFGEFYCSPIFVVIYPDESLQLLGLKVGVFSKTVLQQSFSVFTTAKIFISERKSWQLLLRFANVKSFFIRIDCKTRM